MQLSPSDSLSLERVVQHIGEISTLPHIALRVMQVANDPKSCLADLKSIIEGDTALAARILRYVNSAAFGVRVKITNLQQAIAYLGLKQIRNLAVTASVNELFKKDESLGTYRRSQLWRHLVSVGICARLIAMRWKFANFEDVFLAGLLHDIGIILEDQYVHPQFVLVMNSLAGAKTLCDAERRQLLFDHTTLGECLAEKWRFPPAVRAAIRHHHAPEACREPHMDVVRCVELGNLICSLKGVSSVGVPLVQLSRTTIEALELSRDDVVVLAEDLDAELSRSASLFQA
jgi:putative nucleotidyltransferase with HDIG domain